MSNENELTEAEETELSEFVDRANSFKSLRYQEDKKEASVPSGQGITKSSKNNEETLSPRSLTQYSVYGEGYAPTTRTIKSLPPGCYDIHADQSCVYVVPAIKQSGILLELPEMRSEEVIRIVDIFWDSEKDYKEGNEFVMGGAAYKAGIMVYGPPGSGKSCTLKLVSNKLVERGGTVFYAGTHPSTVFSFISDFAKVEKDRKCIVILEDIDSLINNYGEAIYLDMLDSARSIDNVLFIATTNYPERLDPRIYNRPGRFSHVVKIGLPGAKAREAYLKAILKNHRDVDYIVDNTIGFTIDHLTSLVNGVYREKKNLQRELKRLRILFQTPKVEDKKLGFGLSEEEEENERPYSNESVRK